MSGVRVAIPIWRVMVIGVVAVRLVVSGPTVAVAQHDHRAPVATRAEFRIDANCKPEVAKLLGGGVALLHLGHWGAANDTFRVVTHSDVDCVLGWWGAAMASWGAASDGAGREALARGRAAIASARLARRSSPRERQYVDAVDLLYEGLARDDLPNARRLYESAMEHLSADQPDDDNAALVAALALAERPEPSDAARVANRLAAASAIGRLAAALDHPAVHRGLLVAAQHPAVAPRAYATAESVLKATAPPPELLEAAADLFAAAGRWDRAETGYARAADAARASGAVDDEAHALDGQAYALVQLGRHREATALAERLARMGGAAPARSEALAYPTVRMTAAAVSARVAYETLGWTSRPDDGLATRARALARAGPLADALRLLEPAIVAEALAPGVGPAVLANPPALELRAELQLEFGSAAAALADFEEVLRARPGRLGALHGAALAAAGAGQPARAEEFTRDIVARTGQADEPPPAIVAAARARERLSPAKR